MSWYLSFDCAAKNMGASLYKYDNQYMKKLNALLNSDFKDARDMKSNMSSIINRINNVNLLKAMIAIIDNIISIKFVKLINTIDNTKLKNTNIIDRSYNLKQQLCIIDSVIEHENITNVTVHIEYQMNINNCSLAVMNQLVYHYTKPNYTVKIIYPALKNKLYFHDNLKHRCFIKKYNSNYKSNKEHCKFNFLYFVYVFKLHVILENISLKKIDDIADSFMQSLANVNYG